MKKRSVEKILAILLLFSLFLAACGRRQSGEKDHTSQKSQIVEEETTDMEQKAVNPNAIVKDNSTYDCDLEADKKCDDGHVDIAVGDNLYATQINDWYMNFSQYEGKVVEIEGYYIGEFAPYDFIGRYGPSCPYCQGGYVSFEILTDEDVTQYKSAGDWIKVRGILREGNDKEQGAFYYIEVLQLEKMEKVGQDTVAN